MSIHHIHDYGYKRLFSNITFFQQLLLSFVDIEWVKQLDFSRCEKIDKSYVSEKYKENTSDLLYKIPLSGQDIYICVLLEFQSTCPHHMAIRIAHYILNFYLDEFESNKGIKTVPPVFPIVLYNGKTNWTAPTQLSELIENHQLLGKFSIDFQYFKIIQKEFSVAQLKQIKNLVATVFLAEHALACDDIIQTFLNLFDQEQQENILLFLDWLSYYVQNGKRTEEDYERLRQACRSKQEGATMLQDLLDREREKFRQKGKAEAEAMLQGLLDEEREKFKQQGIAEGEAKGISIGKVEMAKQLLAKGVDISIISQCSDLSEAEIIQLRDDNPPL